jgi:hypothetical protein
VLVAAVIPTAGVLPAGPADAALDIRWYSFKHGHNCYDAQRVDPVTVIFYHLGYADWTTNHIGHHTGWGNNWDPDAQQFVTNGLCYTQHGSRADGWVIETRFHIRWRGGTYADPTYWYFTIGTPHREKAVSCGHAVYPTETGWSGFDAGRQVVWEAMALYGGHYNFSSYVGNSSPRPQCNGWWAQSNGYALYVRIDNP